MCLINKRSMNFLLVFTALKAHAFINPENPFSIELSSNKGYLEQGYLDNYVSDKGNLNLFSVATDTFYKLSGNDSYLHFKSKHYAKINTRIYGLDLIYMTVPCKKYTTLTQFGLELTSYDDTLFQQAVLLHKIRHSDFVFTARYQLPYYGEKTVTRDDGDDILTSMKGLTIGISHAIGNYATFADLMFFNDKNVKDSIHVLDIGAMYNFNYLTIGGSFQFFDGFENESTGFTAYIKLPITEMIGKNNKDESGLFAERNLQVGSLIQKRSS